MRVICSFLIAGLFGIALTPAKCQQLTATISGTAQDQTGAGVPNAPVEVKNAASGDVRKTATNGTGFFTVTALQPGTYSVTVSAKASANGGDLVLGYSRMGGLKETVRLMV